MVGMGVGGLSVATQQPDANTQCHEREEEEYVRHHVQMLTPGAADSAFGATGGAAEFFPAVA